MNVEVYQRCYFLGLEKKAALFTGQPLSFYLLQNKPGKTGITICF